VRQPKHSKFIVFTFLVLLFTSNVYASIDDYKYPFRGPSYSNYGTLGLLQNPNARFLENGSLGFSWTHNEPYLRGSLVAYPFDWMETSYQYTDLNNALYSTSSDFSGSQSFKDKSFDAKFMLLQESDFLPQIALGFRDLAGTGVFSSEFLVASKFVSKNLDFTLGIGWGVMSGQAIENPLARLSERFNKRKYDTGEGGKLSTGSYFSGPAGYFAGIEYTVPNLNSLVIKLEYDGTNYYTEGVLPRPTQESNFNLGIVFPTSHSVSYKLGFIRGNTVSFGFSLKFNLGKRPSKFKTKQTPIKNSKFIKIVTAKSDSNLYKASLKYLSDEQFYLQNAQIDGDELAIVFSQAQYRNPVVSSGRALNILDQISPPSIKKIRISELNGGIGIYSLEINRESYSRGKRHNLPPQANEIEVEPYLYKNEYEFNPLAKYPKFFHSIGPDLRSQIGGPDGFFFGDLKLESKSEILFSRNLSLVSKLSYGLYDNMDSLKLESYSVLPHVRTDIVKYLKNSRNFSISRIQLNKFGQFSPSIFYKLSGGIFETMFSGFGGEILYKPFSQNYAVGIEAWRVKQREYDQMFDHREYSTTTGHISLYFKEPITNVTFRLKGGRFLAEDSGISFEFWRVFNSGFRLGAFFTLTDISFEEFGEGSFDKGFYFRVPLEVFSSRYSKRNFGWGLRPLTRDGGAALIHSHALWGVTNSSHGYNFNTYLNEFYD
jgi:hypothetical protein